MFLLTSCCKFILKDIVFSCFWIDIPFINCVVETFCTIRISIDRRHKSASRSYPFPACRFNCCPVIAWIWIIELNVIRTTRSGNSVGYFIIGICLIDGKQLIIFSIPECMSNGIIRKANMTCLSYEIKRKFKDIENLLYSIKDKHIFQRDLLNLGSNACINDKSVGYLTIFQRIIQTSNQFMHISVKQYLCAITYIPVYRSVIRYNIIEINSLQDVSFGNEFNVMFVSNIVV